MQFSFEKALGIHEPALHTQSRRAQILAANVANADTPKFKARDIDFHAALELAQKYPKGYGPLTTSNTRHIQPAGFRYGYEVLYRQPRQASIDGNTVETETEMSEYTENSVRYMASLRFLGGKIQTLQSAIKGQ
ncbi:MAG: flagellar basal body rod protein FlgB [Gammaproteobacteria bacterium]|nr:flagellar basal body rod protein FlgB [Gammaproteobacteria bacterium]MDH5776573.1 flagellar basal body rod protein FlgB [Gammaproteobacteria bacterium]